MILYVYKYCPNFFPRIYSAIQHEKCKKYKDGSMKLETPTHIKTTYIITTFYKWDSEVLEESKIHVLNQLMENATINIQDRRLSEIIQIYRKIKTKYGI